MVSESQQYARNPKEYVPNRWMAMLLRAAGLAGPGDRFSVFDCLFKFGWLSFAFDFALTGVGCCCFLIKF